MTGTGVAWFAVGLPEEYASKRAARICYTSQNRVSDSPVTPESTVKVPKLFREVVISSGSRCCRCNRSSHGGNEVVEAFD
jgi:hypothetical protein